MVDLGEVVLFWSEVLHVDSEDMLIVGDRLATINIAIPSLLQCQQLIQPVVQFILSLKHYGHTIIQSVESDHEFVPRVPGVQFSVDIETIF